MPADPVKAVWWFMHWLLQVLVRFFWLPILVMAGIEIYVGWHVSGIFNGLVSGVITLLVGVVVWGILWAILVFVNISTRISRVIADVNQFRSPQDTFFPRPSSPFVDRDAENNVVEGTVTNLEEERQKRRRE